MVRNLFLCCCPSNQLLMSCYLTGISTNWGLFWTLSMKIMASALTVSTLHTFTLACGKAALPGIPKTWIFTALTISTLVSQKVGIGKLQLVFLLLSLQNSSNFSISSVPPEHGARLERLANNFFTANYKECPAYLR